MSLALSDRWLSVPPLGCLEGQRSGSVGGGGSEMGVSDPFLRSSTLSLVPVPFVSYSPGSIKGKALLGEVHSLIAKGAVEPAPPSLGFYSRLFVVWKTSGSLRPVIDLSVLNGFVLQTQFKMETSQSVLQSIRRNDGLWLQFRRSFTVCVFAFCII